jgi:hypothetical protein
MKSFTRICFFVLVFTTVMAWPQTPSVKNSVKPSSTAPKIPVELQKEAFKAQSEYLQAESALEQTPQFKAMTAKREALTAASQKLMAVCGSDFSLQMDSVSGDPVCLPKPEVPKPTEKK